MEIDSRRLGLKEPVARPVAAQTDRYSFIPPKVRTSLTVKCSDTELLVEAPGSARIVGNMTVFHPEPVPTEKAHVIMSIKPTGAERPIVIDRLLEPAPVKGGESIRRWFWVGRF